MSRIRNALTARERLNWYLAIGLVFLGLLLVHAHYRLANVQQDFRMHVPPDLSEGAVLRPNMPEQANVYMYTLYIWKQINEWLESGLADYDSNVDEMKCYLSPDMYKWLKDDVKKRRTNGELSRTRSISPATFYTKEHVKSLGNGTWYVWLDLSLVERVVGEEVKNVVMRYPLYAYRDSRSCNEFGVSVGGFFNDPARIGVGGEL
jgi:integrating conjugative element protein (TIGR03746 family)